MRRFSCACAVAAVALIAIPSGASAATTIGETFTPVAPACSENFTFLQSVSPGAQYASPSAGVIASWSFQADAAPPPLKFKVARPAGVNKFTMIGESALVTPQPNVLNTYPVQIPVQAGDLIGFYTSTMLNCNRPRSGYRYHYKQGDVVPPTTADFTLNTVTEYQLDLSAILEPDCDKDGLGDETQDKNVACGTCKGQQVTVAGTNGPDQLVGTTGRDVISSLGGNDKASGLAGNDVICGGVGKDTLKGGPGNDFLSGQKGKDKLVGQKGKDKLSGKKGKDVCVGGAGTDKAKGCENTKSI
jgi:hypothetical protein